MINDLWSEKKDDELPVDDESIQAMVQVAHQLMVFDQSLIKEGFTKQQAYDLTNTYMVTLLSGVAQPKPVVPIRAINK